MNAQIFQQSDFDGLYNKSNFLGTGGFGTVYKVTEKKTGKIYAMKILNGQDDSLLNNFENEINILLTLSHPMLISFHGITFSPYCMITEFVENKSVQYYIDQSIKGLEEKEWNITNKMIIVIGIAYGMRYLHSHNPKISHRDLKPENVLLDSNFFPKICDFGLSKTTGSSQKMKTGGVGTLAFCAPEVLMKADDQKYDGEKADVYSYGMTIYSLLYDQIPFEDLQIMGIFQEVIMNKKRPELTGQFSTTIDNLITRCWDNDPENRPTFNEIVNELINNIIKGITEIDIVKINEFLPLCDESKMDKTHVYDFESKMNNTQGNDFELNFENLPDHKKDKLFTKLHFAAKINDKNQGEILISKGANINAIDIIYQNLNFLFLMK